MDTPKIDYQPEPNQPKPQIAFSLSDRLLVPVVAVLCFIVVVALSAQGSMPRLGIALPFIAAQGVFIWYCGRENLNRAGLLVMGAGTLLALSFVANANMSLYGINLLAMLALTIWGALMATGPFNWERPRGFIAGSFYALALMFLDIDKSFKASVHGIKNKSFLKVILGVIVSAPILLIVVGLLANADAQFERFTSSILSNISEHITIFCARAFFAFCMAIVMYSFFYGARSKRAVRDVPLSGDGEPKGGDGIIFLTMTALLNVIYAVFVFMQFVYLFAGRLPAEFTYAEYARRGFFELAFITLINLSVVLFALTFTDKSRRTALYMRAACGIMLVFTSIILVSAVWRMVMYIGAYGMSVLRFFVLWGELVMLIWIVLSFAKIIKPERKIFKPAALISLVLYVALNFCNVDYIVAYYNLSHGKIDRYLDTLSTDTLLAGDVNASKRSQAVGRSQNFWTWNITDAVVAWQTDK